MSGLLFEKVFMDTNFKNCQSIYDKLSKRLEHIDIKQFGNIKEINEKILALSTEMYKLLCVTESVFVYNQKLKCNSVNNFTFKGIDILDNVTSNVDPYNLNATITKPLVVERHVDCNGQNNFASGLASLPLIGTTLQDSEKAEQTPKLSNEGNSITDTSSLVVTSKMRSEIHRTILYKDEKYTCNVCAVTIKNIEDVFSHINSVEHISICKDPSACFENILKDSCNLGAFWNFVPMYLKICKTYIQPTGFNCTLCKCSIPCNAHGIYLHIAGKKHLNNIPTCLQMEK